MSYSIFQNNVVLQRIYVQDLDQVAIMSRYWRLGAISGASLVNSLDVIGQLVSATEAPLAAMLSFRVKIQGHMLYLAFPTTAPRPRPEIAATGTAGSQAVVLPMPHQVSGVLSVQTGVLGRTGQGRTYMPFPTSADNDTATDTPSAGYLAGMDNFADQWCKPQTMVFGAVTATFQPCLLDAGGTGPLDILNHINRQAWGTQRRRGNYGALNRNPF